jgi:hypothetical protein
MADEYIKRSEVLKFPIRLNHYDKKNGDINFVCGIESVMEYIEEIPAADVAEVKHGYWKEETEYYDDDWGECNVREVFECSLCGRTERRKEPYCNCGAKMDEKGG